MKIPFFNSTARATTNCNLIKQVVFQVGTANQFILKDRVTDLEGQIQKATGARYAVGVSNETYALTLSLVAMRVESGVDVLISALSSPSLVNAIIHVGGKPIFADVNPDTYTLEPGVLEEKITPKTQVIILVPLFATMADISAITRIANLQGLRVIENSAMALGMCLDQCGDGLLGDVGVSSFGPTKSLGGIGEAGMIVTDDEEIGHQCRLLRNHGQDGINRFLHHVLGYNARMDEIVAAYLSHSFHSLPDRIRRRTEIAECYNAQFKTLFPRVKIPPVLPYDRVDYTYLIQVDCRDALRTYLVEQGIETQLYSPNPFHLQPAFIDLGYKPEDFPVSEQIRRQTLALPLYSEMRDEHVDIIVDAVKNFYF